MIFLLSYKGKKRWGYDSEKVVRAKDEEAARRMFGQPPEDWAIEKIEPEGDDDILARCWVGDQG